MIPRLLLLMVLLTNDTLLAQTASVLPAKDSILAEVKRMQRGASDKERTAAAERFDRMVNGFLTADSSLDQRPDIAPNIAVVNAPDGRWRMLTWVVPTYDGSSYRYHGYLQWKSEKRGRIILDRLIDSTEAVRKPESEKLSTERWFGATYYETVSKKRFRKTHYVVLGWKGKDTKVTQKVIDVLTFDGDKPRFGMPLFKKERIVRSRILFSFNATASMSLRYEPSRRMIVYDHLFAPKLQGGLLDPSQAGPDGTYEGYRFRRGKWQWKGDLDMRMKKARN